MKLARRHKVSRDEILQCFANRDGTYLEDTREFNQTTPPTLWFISETDYARKLKIVFIQDENDITIRTAYEPNGIEIQIYERKHK